ncbi:uncharacterized protein LOC112567916 [Pomacea canaliculata]|uniref:uncharacterized protein LOC112567916 n=1 Tax=Pomacea canaliculata TaxID=400727 RepID=UPI000D73CEAD|nr:uncharacterized protein LOC112567916 [Pomacea canaliculata]
MDALCRVVLFLFVCGNGNTSAMTCTPKETNQDSYENSVHAENAYANFSYRLTTSRMNETSEDSNFRIEVKLYDAGTLRTACVCLWLSRNDPVCKILWNDSICEADTSEMHFSLLIKRTYTNITWVCFQQNYAPVVLKQRTLQVTYSPKITALHVNGQDVNGTHVGEQHQEVNISCYFTNGSPLVSIRILDDTGHTLSSTTHGQGPLMLSLGIYHCQDNWPVIRCEALGSEINRSVAIVVRCPPQLSYMTSQIADLKTIQDGGMTFAMKSYTGDIRKCLMTQVQSRSSAREVKCDVRGHPPQFTLTLRPFNESWIGEGIWTLQVMNELGASSITFHLINNTG